MNLYLISVANRAEAWVEAGYAHYARRLQREVNLILKVLPLPKRSQKGDIERLKRQEAGLIEAALPPRAHTVALEVEGQRWSTEQLASQLAQWQQLARPVALIVGGPDGIESELSRGCQQSWSLSPLTLPHPLVRIVVAEQLYRAWSLLNNHPYHRL
ncbi:23S rRNA (pseudouridine(1915)-N(3))-methyltransferase RlmH [Ectothiorhodospiraceae bacterium BW-2]|nr:23S rRNA (pseudouridine(1915)-N(3))-methyltransferase RlmH [Ectothiorhodospiraceae bacterium BW-2]